ncbi:glycosyltransferase [Nocardiopsis sp. CNT-189]|uniref:glycosyltransferase n=1 Tax=Nocardiopsis oceanisediminis TaxID=2816862 RepID=UPI003B2F29FD
MTVVIPVHDMRPQLRNTLRGLRSQTVPADRFEVIVVDDASTDGAVDAGEPGPGAHWEVVRVDPGRGAAAARNTGAARARGEVLVFLDADCLPHPDMLARHRAAQTGQGVAATGYTYARELTPEQWDLLYGTDWDFGDPAAVFSRSEREPRLHDARADLLTRPSDCSWAYFWSSVVSLRRTDFERVGGFCEEFPGKGVEDMEMGYRLRRAGIPTVLLGDALAFHQPHARDRRADLVRDRCNDFLMLRLHPGMEVEAVCAFGAPGARVLEPALRSFAERLDPAAVDTARLGELPRVLEALGGPDGTLLLGDDGGWPEDAPRPARTVSPVRKGGDRLLGARLPFGTAAFDTAVVTDYWRTLPEPTLCRVLDEAARCARRLILLDGAATRPPSGPDPALSAALEHGDRPWWEFSFPLRRELHQFRLTGLDSAPGGPRALEAEPLPWSTGSFSGVLDAV